MSTLPPSVRLDTEGELPILHVDGADGWAVISLHGAHVMTWGPHGQPPGLWMSTRSHLDAATAIRGGIPVCFPWFGPLTGHPEAPRHGFARTSLWTLDGAEDDGHDVSVRLTLRDSERTRASAWPYPFSAVVTVVVGVRLTVSLQVTSTGEQPVSYEEALHTYLAVTDVTSAEVTGLEEIPYVDKTAGGAQRPGEPGPVRPSDELDRIYPGALAPVTVLDAGGRWTQVTKRGSASTVVWNPWRDGARATADMDDDGWTTMLCVEAANVGPAAIHLAPGESHTLSTTIETSTVPTLTTSTEV